MQYPNLTEGKTPLVVDIETFDPGIKTYGPSNYRKPGGRIIGVALSDGAFTEYYDLPNEHNLQYIKDQLCTDRPKLGHNIVYDVDWLESRGIKVNGKLHDSSTAENSDR